MRIDDIIVNKYLEDKSFDNHWIFDQIKDNEHLYKQPAKELKNNIRTLHSQLISKLTTFTPYNLDIFTSLFPQWQTTLDNIDILLIVGAPAPYDAMTRIYNGTEYIIFDLVRFNSYAQNGHNILDIILSLITHEFAHVCIHQKYPFPNDNYIAKLKHITFDEGFAHTLAFYDNIKEFDFKKHVDAYYSKSIEMLKIAMNETSVEKQKEYLEKSNSGSYWDKFGAISGKLFLFQNIKHIETIYNNGIDYMIEKMGVLNN